MLLCQKNHLLVRRLSGAALDRPWVAIGSLDTATRSVWNNSRVLLQWQRAPIFLVSARSLQEIRRNLQVSFFSKSSEEVQVPSLPLSNLDATKMDDTNKNKNAKATHRKKHVKLKNSTEKEKKKDIHKPVEKKDISKRRTSGGGIVDQKTKKVISNNQSTKSVRTKQDIESSDGTSGDSEMYQAQTTPKEPLKSQSKQLKQDEIQGGDAHKKNSRQRKTPHFFRIRLHTRYYKELWEACEEQRHKRSQQEIELFLDNMVRNGGNPFRLVAAAFRLHDRVKMASDYNHENQEVSSSSFLGPITLVIPLVRFNAKGKDHELFQMASFFCNLADDPVAKTDAEDDTESLSETAIEADDGDTIVQEDESDGVTTAGTSALDSDDAHNDFAQILLLVRFRSLFISPLFWGKPNEAMLESRRRSYLQKLPEEREKEALDLAVLLRRTLSSKQFDRTQSVLENYLNATDKLAETRLGVAGATNELTSQQGSSSQPVIVNLPIRRLNKYLYRASRTHFHWIASDFARFLDHDEEFVGQGAGTCGNDPLVEKGRSWWVQKRSEMVNKLTDVQDGLFESIKRIRSRLETKDEGMERAELDPVFMLDMGTIKSERKRNKKPSLHFCYEAIVDEGNLSIPAAPPHFVLLDNLPIDVTQEELEDCYGRCGKIQSISILNRRPDLDPGPPSKTELKDIRKGAAGKNYVFSRGSRPRSPVYALIEFSDEIGYEKAIQPNLSVFGMVLRRHDVRSIPASNRLRTLFIEKTEEEEESQAHSNEKSKISLKLAFPFFATEIESELQKVLGPLWITLKSGQDLGAIVGSCQLDFPSFDTAWYSYTKLKSIHPSLQNVHWMKTPKDAKEWWTRKRGFFF